MFERRLKWFTIVLALVAVALLVRLYELQVVRADEFDALSTRLLTRPVRYLPAPRGRIVARDGRALVADEPAWDVSVHYGVIAGRSDYLWAKARELRRAGRYPASAPLSEIVDDMRVQIPLVWQRLGELTGRPVSEFLERADEIRAQVERLRALVERSTGLPQPVAEENALHPLLEGIDNETALSIRLELEKHPWLRVVPGSRRVARDADDFVHVLGRTGAASRERIDADPDRADELRRLRPGDQCGVSGVERAAESLLRGVRGRIVEDADRRELERVEPTPGRDVRLTISPELQRRALEYLAEAVAGVPTPAGAAAVVIDVTSREVVVLASYPTYPIAEHAERYAELAADTKHSPLLFRAVAGQYAPGSICKAITLIGGLSDRLINEHSTFECRGYLNRPDAFRCWIYNQHGGVHGPQDAEQAVRNSCNIYFYNVGEKLGPQRLCDWFSRFGLGRRQGTGLIEEVDGIVPSADWLRRRSGREPQVSDAWNFSIGQGEVTVTPLQAANVAATIAAGRWAPVTLISPADEPLEASDPGAEVEMDDAALRVLRTGMWRVVNDDGGTADRARLERRDFDLLGKTGSAQAVPQVLSRRYIFEWPDGRREDVIATSEAEAWERFAGADPKPRLAGYRAAERYPELGEDERLPSHAWFMGYIQPARTKRGARPLGRVYALSVLIEFGGSGGKVAGPVAKKLAEAVLEENDE